MLNRILSRAWQRLRPEEGWLAFFLLAAIIATVAAAVISADWTSDSGLAGWTAVLGMLLAVLLAKRPLGGLAAWSLLLVYGLVVTILLLGRLSPPLRVIAGGWWPFSDHVRHALLLMVDRAAGWLEAITSGGRSEETIVFTFGLALLTWLLAAYAGWSTFRQHRPLASLTVMGFALAVNGFYSDASLWPVALFSGLSALLAAAIHYADLEKRWDSRGVDYSGQIRFELLMFSGGIALVLLILSSIVPSVNIRQIYRILLDRPAVHQVEDTLERTFAGVRQPRSGPSAEEVAGQATTERSTMPRGYLLGNPPELSEIVVITATVQGQVPPVTHWRTLSYDVYTGRGWSISGERRESLAAGEPVPTPAYQRQTMLEQVVHWLPGQARNRYTLGQPVSFDQDVTLFWRGLDDLSRVQGSGNIYRAESSASAAEPDQLRLSRLADVPDLIMARYTSLPEGMPDRIRDLANQIAGDARLSPYDQAKILERFLRQYPYSLEVNLPPAGVDPVDYFLFELQAGYCDYYASAMVVMARSLGLPARLGAGFLAKSPDERGVQTIYQIDGHSWAEIFFAGYGWVEFEPTAAFPSQGDGALGQLVDETGLGEIPGADQPPPIPEVDRQRFPVWWLLSFLLFFVPLGWWLRQRRRARLGDVVWAYGQLLKSARRLGLSTPPNQTPLEFENAFAHRLRQLQDKPMTGRLRPGGLARETGFLVGDYVERRYGGQRTTSNRAITTWQRIRARLWLLAILERFLARWPS